MVRAPLFPLLFFVAAMLLKPPAWKFKLPGCTKGGVLVVLKNFGAELQNRRFCEVEILQD